MDRLEKKQTDLLQKFVLLFIHICNIVINISLVTGTEGRGKRVPGFYCSHMCQVATVTCILLGYTKITTKFSLPAERPHCRTMFLERHIWKDLKSETISL